ncbi:MAG: hypothetical protein ABI345_13995 [Jatrophihabitans sp.]
MRVPSVVSRHPSLRWLAPIAVAGLAGLAATGMFRADVTSDSLPKASPAALIAAVQAPMTVAFSGTVISRLDLGLPEMPSLGVDRQSASVSSLLSGSHTVQVWYGGEQRQRIAVLGSTDETDVFRSGPDLWQWNSADRSAVHTILPPWMGLTTPAAVPTPAALASRALESLDPTTKIVVRTDHRVANRSAYELILTPQTLSTRVGSVHIAVDGRTKVPLSVQVYSRGATSAAIDVTFTSIRFNHPPKTYFTFTPPSNASVRTVDLRDSPRTANGATGRIGTYGSGWTTVYTYRARGHLTLDPALRSACTRESGAWGKGELFASQLVSVLITDNGHIYAGAVDPDALFAAAGSR